MRGQAPKPRYERDHGTYHMGRLEGAVDRQLAGHRIHGGDAAAGFDRRRVDALIAHLFLDRDRGAVEGLVGGVLVAGLPIEDVIRMAAGKQCY